jgi:hypothetical protein
MNTTYIKTISIKDVYGTDTPEIPKGYKALAFRPPKFGELYLNEHLMGPTEAFCLTEDYAMYPRIILSKLPDPQVVVKGNVEATLTTTVNDIYRGDVTIPEGYEFVDFRTPKKGDIFITYWGRNLSNTEENWSDTAGNMRIIIKKCS